MLELGRYFTHAALSMLDGDSVGYVQTICCGVTKAG